MFSETYLLYVALMCANAPPPASPVSKYVVSFNVIENISTVRSFNVGECPEQEVHIRIRSELQFIWNGSNGPAKPWNPADAGRYSRWALALF